MKKVAVILLMLFGLVGQARAHSFLTDRDITVLLHTNPDDDPIVGQPAAVLLQVTDSTNKYSSSKCDCEISIAEGNKVLFAGPLLYIVGASVYDLTAPFTFPEKAVYQITVTGKPKVVGEFQDFRVEYDLRVDRGSVAPAPKPDNSKIWFMVAGAIVFAVGIMSVIYFNRTNIKR